jgi:hypothetical protein
MTAKKSYLHKGSRFRLPAALAISAGLIVFGYLITRIFAAGSATLYLTPASGTYNIGSSVNVQIWANTGTDSSNAVEADLSYPQAQLQFVSIDGTGSAFGIAAAGSGGSGSVTIARGVTGGQPPVTGAVLVATVKFNVIASGSAPITFKNSSAIVRASDSTNILNTTVGATYTIAAAATPTPTPVATHTPTPTPAPGHTATPTPKPGTTATPTVTPTPTASASSTPVAGNTTPTPSASSTPAGSNTPIPTPGTQVTKVAKSSPTLILGAAAIGIPLLLLLVVGGLVMSRHKVPVPHTASDEAEASVSNSLTEGGATTDSSLPGAPAPHSTFMPQGDSTPAAGTESEPATTPDDTPAADDPASDTQASSGDSADKPADDAPASDDKPADAKPDDA